MMREEILVQAGQVPWALRSQQDLEIALSRYLSRAPGAAAPAPAASPRGGGVMVIPIYGIIGQATDLFDFPDTPVEWLSAKIDEAANSDAIQAVVLDVNSPGGGVYGVPEAAAKIRELRKTKPVVSVVNGMMASAAYWLGSAASSVVITPSSEVGSIGVWSAHVDASKFYERLGLKFTLISAGEFKVEGNPYGPLEPEALAYRQSRIDEYMDMFVRGVAQNRNTSVKTVRDTYGKGRVLGAHQAVAVGMVDRIGTMQEAINQVARQTASSRAATRQALAARQALLERRQALDSSES